MSNFTQPVPTPLQTFSETCLALWHTDLAKNITTDSTALLERATATAFPQEYLSARTATLAPNPIAAALLTEILGSEIRYKSQWDYPGAVDPWYLPAMQRVLDTDLSYSGMRENFWGELEFVSMGFRGEEFVVNVHPFPLYRAYSAEVGRRRGLAAWEIATELYGILERELLERDCGEVERAWPHVIREYREDCITLRASGRWLTGRETGRQGRLQERVWLEKVEAVQWRRMGGLRSQVLPTIDGVLGLQPNVKVAGGGLAASQPSLSSGLAQLAVSGERTAHFAEEA